MAQKILGEKNKRTTLSWRGFLALAIFLFPFWMLLVWFFTPNRKLLIAIVDKTVIEYPGQEHLSLHWVLNQEKFTKNKKDGYDVDKDYFGFFQWKKSNIK